MMTSHRCLMSYNTTLLSENQILQVFLLTSKVGDLKFMIF